MIKCADVLMTMQYGKYKPIYDTILLDTNKDNTLEDLQQKSEFYLNSRIDIIRFLDDDLVCIKNKDLNFKYGICDICGNIILDLIYDGIGNYFSDGLIKVFKNGRYGFINKKGEEVIECNYKNVRPFHEGLAAVQDKESNLWGYINNNGKLVIDYQFFSARDFYSGLSLVNNNQYIDKEGNVKICMNGDSSYYDFYDDIAIICKKRFYQDDILYGYIDINGNEFISRQYDIAYPFYGGMALVGNKQYYDYYVGEDNKNYKFNFFYIDKYNNKIIPSKKQEDEYQLFLYKNFDEIDICNNRNQFSLRGYKIDNGHLICLDNSERILIKCNIYYKRSIYDINSFYDFFENNLFNAYNFVNNEFIFLKDYKIGTKIILEDGEIVIDENTNPKEKGTIKVLIR